MATVYMRTLARAADILGGEGPLAQYLSVVPSHLALWLSGTESPPTEIFLRAVDVVCDADLLGLQAPRNLDSHAKSPADAGPAPDPSDAE